MNHPYFAGQVVADHQADLIEQARRHRLLRGTAEHGDRASAAGEPRHPPAARLRPWTRTEPHLSTRNARSPLPLLNLLLAATALTVAAVALATDEAASRPVTTVVTPVDGNHSAARPVDEDITEADRPRQYNPYQPRVPLTGIPAGDCALRRLVVRC
jgi:hypothetical protein